MGELRVGRLRLSRTGNFRLDRYLAPLGQIDRGGGAKHAVRVDGMDRRHGNTPSVFRDRHHHSTNPGRSRACPIRPTPRPVPFSTVPNNPGGLTIPGETPWSTFDPMFHVKHFSLLIHAIYLRSLSGGGARVRFAVGAPAVPGVIGTAYRRVRLVRNAGWRGPRRDRHSLPSGSFCSLPLLLR